MGLAGWALAALGTALSCVVAQPSAHRRRRSSGAAARNSTQIAVTVRLGGSLGLTGGLSDASRASLRGLTLLAEWVNRTGALRGPGDAPLAVRLALEDDEGDPSRVAEIYLRMAALREVDFFLGRANSFALSTVAARVSNSTGLLTMLSGSVLPADRLRDSPNVFTTGVAAADHMAHALETVRAQGARSLAVLWDASEFHTAVCSGVMRHARRLDMRVLDHVSLNGDLMTSQLQHLKALSPDVLIGCGQFRASVQIVVSARALGFNPQGIILSMASPWAFVRAVGVSNANYIMSPASWVPSLNLSCPVFGSAEGFARAYRERWGEEPTSQSAEAAGGGLALLAAVEAAGTLDTEVVRTALLSLDIETFYARFSFNRDGTRGNASMATEQVQPLGRDRPTTERHAFSDVAPVGPESPPRWPMPSWVQKEIEVYPCPPGETWHVHINSTGHEALACELCPTGRYRHLRSIVCEECEAGQYSSEAGSSQCEVCPTGANCPEGFRPGRPDARAGYYKLPFGRLSIMACSPEQLCTGRNECRGKNTGILCEQCMPGYARLHLGIISKTCTACRSGAWNVFAIMLTVTLYTLYIWLIVKATLSATKSIRAIHSVILKICVNYLQFAGTAFEATEFRTMVVSIGGGRADFMLPLIAIPEMLQYPFASLISLDCLLPNVGIRTYQAAIVVGLSLMPVAFLLKTLLAFVRKELLRKRLTPRLRLWWHFARSRARRPTRGSGDPEPGRADGAADPCGLEAAFSGDGGGGGGGARLCSIGREGAISLKLPEGAAPARGTARSSADELPYWCQGTPMSPCWDRTPVPWRRTVLLSSFFTRFVNSSIVMSFVLHPVVVRLLVVGFECVDLDVLRQKHDLDVTCRSEQHMRWLGWSTIGLVVFGLGTPVILFCMLWRVRKRLLHADVRKRFGFLYNGFELRYYYFESVYMFRKVVILLFFTFPTMYVRMVLMLFISWTFILLHIHYAPFDNRSYCCLDRLEAMNLRALTATVTARLLFDVRRELLSGQFFEELARHPLVDALLVCVPLLFHAWFVGFAAWSLFRNTVLKHLSLKADVWPERMTRVQHLLLRLEQCRHKATFDEDNGRIWVDTSDLTKKERDYLRVALGDTLHRYMDSERRVHPGLIKDAVRDALKSCQRTRQKRVEHIELLRKQQGEQRGCLPTLRRWRGELSLSLHGPHRLDVSRQDERGCVHTLCLWLAELGGILCSRLRRGGPRAPATPRRTQAHKQLVCTREFTVEEFYDALMPIWLEITEGRMPFSSERERGVAPDYRSISELMTQRSAGMHSGASAGSGTYGSGSEREKQATPLEEERRMEQLLGLSLQHLQTPRTGSSGVESLTEPHHVERFTLLRQHEELLGETLKLRAENEALRHRVASAARAPLMAQAPCKAAEEAATPAASELERSPAFAAGGAGSPAAAAGDGLRARAAEQPLPLPPPEGRPSGTGADTAASVPPPSTLLAPPPLSSPLPSRLPRPSKLPPLELPPPRCASEVVPTVGGLPGSTASTTSPAPPTRPSGGSSRSPDRARASGAGAGNGAQGAAAAGLLPGVRRRPGPGSARSASTPAGPSVRSSPRSGSPFSSGSRSGRSHCPAATRATSAWALAMRSSSILPEAPWSGAMRPAGSVAWPQTVSFEFQSALRPASPEVFQEMGTP